MPPNSVQVPVLMSPAQKRRLACKAKEMDLTERVWEAFARTIQLADKVEVLTTTIAKQQHHIEVLTVGTGSRRQTPATPVRPLLTTAAPFPAAAQRAHSLRSLRDEIFL